jgi:hypothetical protein
MNRRHPPVIHGHREKSMNDSYRSGRLSGLRIAALVAGISILAACASTPPAPTASLAAARLAIGDAEKAGAGRYAAPELSEAREKLTAADSAVERKAMPAAQRLAEQSRVQADLASAKSGEAKAAEVNAEMKQGNDALLEEMARKSPGAQQ